MPINRLEKGAGKAAAHAGARDAILLSILALLTCFFLIPHAGAQETKKILSPAILDDQTNVLPIGPYSFLQKDPKGSVTPQTIRSSHGQILNGVIQDHERVSLGRDGASTWLVFKLKNTGENNDWILDLGYRADGQIGTLQTIHLYEVRFPQENEMPAELVDTVREIPASFGAHTFSLEIPKGEEKIMALNIKAKADRPAILPLRIFSPHGYMNVVEHRSSLDTFFLFALGGIGIYILAISLMRKHYKYTSFAGYFLFLSLSWLIYNSSGFGMGESYAFLNATFMYILSLSMIFTVKVLYDINYAKYSERYILYFLAALCTASTVLVNIGITDNNSVISISLLYLPPSGTFVTLAVMTVANARSIGPKRNKLFYAMTALICGFATTILTFMDLLPYGFLTNNVFWFFLIPHGLFLASALGEKLETLSGLNFSYNKGDQRVLNLGQVKKVKDTADHSRLLKVVERERELLAEFRAKEGRRMEEMRLAKVAADEANRAKSAFLAVVSHEIRTPMTGIMGMVRLLMDSNISKQQRDYVMAIQESSDAMLGLLNDILDFEKIQQGKIELENISFDLPRLVQGVVTLMSGHAAEKGISLNARMDDDIPRFVKGDPTRLRQVLLNLMGNAIKFTSQGGVTLLIKNLTTGGDPSSISGAKNEKNMIYFGVQDTGIGISQEGQKNLFNPFSQADSSISRKFGGTGLGLAISKGLIERMGSSVNITSKEGEGSTFFFTLEMERGISSQGEQTKRTSASENGGMIQPLKILVVEDNPITRKVVEGFLSDTPHSVEACALAEEALERINRNVYDLVFMDIELPRMKGTEAVKQIRDHKDRAKAQIPVFAMTGNVAREDMESYIADGMTGILTKPIEPDKLREIVNDISMKSFEREIHGPGRNTAAIAEEEPSSSFDQKNFEKDVSPHPEADGVFDPVMLQSLKDTIGIKPLMELLDDLIVKTDELLGAMDMAAQSGDLKSLAARAHELKGMAGNFGLVEMSTLAAQAEKKAKMEETEGIAPLLQSFGEANLRAQEVLKHWVSH